MKLDLLRLLKCPRCSGELILSDGTPVAGEVEWGRLDCACCGSLYPIQRFVPRFVSTDNYANNFGFQWAQFRRTQLDSQSGVSISRRRFFEESGWTPEKLAGSLVLDVGCGAGRFTEVALSCGARVVAMDYSSAVDACWENLGTNPTLHVVQADLTRMPFRPGVFDFVYCFGVLQHTPDVRRSLLSLPQAARLGGRVVVDVYPQTGWEALWPKYWLRPLTKRMAPERLFAIVKVLTRPLLLVSTVIGRIPKIGRRLRYIIPVANYEGVYPLSPSQRLQWSMLDTFDMLSPAHDHPQTEDALRAWLGEAGLDEVEVFRRGQLVGRGLKGPGRPDL